VGTGVAEPLSAVAGRVGWLTALWVRCNSAAASVKLKCRAATAKTTWDAWA